MQPFYKSNNDFKKDYVEEIHDSNSLMQKELDVNLAEQVLLAKRIELMKQLLNDIPSSDPQYVMLLTQVQMDQIELSELKMRADQISQKLI